jgi:hypothetical protein
MTVFGASSATPGTSMTARRQGMLQRPGMNRPQRQRMNRQRKHEHQRQRMNTTSGRA